MDTSAKVPTQRRLHYAAVGYFSCSLVEEYLTGITVTDRELNYALHGHPAAYCLYGSLRCYRDQRCWENFFDPRKQTSDDSTFLGFLNLELKNVASGKPAIQSSTYRDDHVLFGARLANDDSALTCSKTQWSWTLFWRTDLLVSFRHDGKGSNVVMLSELNYLRIFGSLRLHVFRYFPPNFREASRSGRLPDKLLVMCRCQ